jgi:hypothetical protein
VLPILTAPVSRGPGPDWDRVPAGVSPLVARLRRDAAFSLVTEMMPIPSGALGMEALREASARYRLRYVILYREVIAKKDHLNAWAWGYATAIGALFLPGKQHEVFGYIEATMFDVKTGLLMFTTRRSVMASARANEWRTEDKLAQLASNTVAKFSPDLARDFLLDVRREGLPAGRGSVVGRGRVARPARRLHARDGPPPSGIPERRRGGHVPCGGGAQRSARAGR